jgi:hypothetical protein
MKKFLLLFSLCISAVLGYAQPVTTAPKNQPQVGNLPIQKQEIITETKNGPVVSQVDKTAKPPAKLTPVCYGKVSADGTIISGTENFTIDKRPGYGLYNISCAGITDKSLVFIAARSYKYQPAYEILSPSSHTINVHMHRGLEIPITDSEFQFIIYTP